jgi:hypothetical protein
MTQEIFSVPNGYEAWMCPVGVSTILVECWGGGAGGRANISTGGCGGGGGGAYARRNAVSVLPGQGYPYLVGAGGIGYNNGTVSSGPGTCSAAGGTRPTTSSGGGLGGSLASSVGDVKYAGGVGGSGSLINVGGGG